MSSKISFCRNSVTTYPRGNMIIEAIAILSALSAFSAGSAGFSFWKFKQAQTCLIDRRRERNLFNEEAKWYGQVTLDSVSLAKSYAINAENHATATYRSASQPARALCSACGRIVARYRTDAGKVICANCTGSN